MPYVIPENVGTTLRGSLSARRRLGVWERTGGACVVCGTRIDGVRERWIVEHVRALELGGADELENMGPAHEVCARAKTREDHTRTARAKRPKTLHLGASVTLRPLPGSRSSPLKRKINGQVILREEPLCRPEAAASTTSEVPPRLAGESVYGRADPTCSARHPSGMVNEDGTKEVAVQKPVSKDPTDAPSAAEEARAVSDDARTVLPAIPHHLGFLFDDKPLLADEDPAQYEALLREFVREIGPKDVVDAIYVKDIVDLIWEAQRLRRWRRLILRQARFDAANSLIVPLIEAQSDGMYSFTRPSEAKHKATHTVAGWMQGQPESISEFKWLLQARGLTPEDVMAAAFRVALPEIERIDRMAAAADTRRDGLLREIERKRAALGQQLRAASEEVLDLEPTEPLERS